MNEQEQTIDLRDLFKVLRDHLVPIIIITVTAGLIGFLLSAFIIEKQYTAEALLYVENTAEKSQGGININDISAAQKLANTCQILFTTEEMYNQLNEVINNSSDTKWDKEKMDKMITVESVNSTEIIQITVTTNNPSLSVTVAEKMVELSQDEFMRVIEDGSIKVVSHASYSDDPTFPSVRKFTLIGLLIGLVVSYVIFLLAELLDTKIKEDDDLAQVYGIPVFAEIMDFEAAFGRANGKGGYNYEYGYGGYGYGYDYDYSYGQESSQGK